MNIKYEVCYKRQLAIWNARIEEDDNTDGFEGEEILEEQQYSSPSQK